MRRRGEPIGFPTWEVRVQLNFQDFPHYHNVPRPRREQSSGVIKSYYIVAETENLAREHVHTRAARDGYTVEIVLEVREVSP